MELTKTQIIDAIHSGKVDQSLLALEIINEAKNLTGVEIVACYAQFDTYLATHPAKASKNKPNQFVNHSFLRVYVRDYSMPEDAESFETQITAIFTDFIEKHKDEIVRPRIIVPEEQKYYGWLNTPKSQHDDSQIINPKEGDVFSEKIKVKTESFDGLAIWHYLSDSLNALNSLDRVKKLYAKVTCGWDEKRGQMNLTVVLPGAVTDEIRAAITAPMLEVVKKRDKWGIITEETFAPIFKSRGNLSAEEMFDLLRN